MIGIFAMRWNVVIGGQLFSKSFLGYTTYKMAFATREGLLTAIALLILPFIILWVLVKLLPPWPESASLPGSAPLRHTEPARPRLIGADAEKRMAQALEGIASDRDQLSDRVRELERRVSALEGQPEIQSPAPPASGGVGRDRGLPRRGVASRRPTCPLR